MFFHLADKIYIVNKRSQPEKTPDINQVAYTVFKESSVLYPTFSHYVKDIVAKYVKDRKVTLLIVPEDDFENLLSLYISRLSLGVSGFNAMICYSNYCEECVEDFCQTISNQSDFVPTFTQTKSETIRFPDIFPAELCINQIDDCDWARKKYEYFRMYELYAKIKDVQYYMLRHGIQFDFNIGNDDQKIKELYRNEDFLRNISRCIDISFIEQPLKSYVNSNPTFGYNRFNTWKFNWQLAKQLKACGYRIGIKNEEDKRNSIA